MGLAKVRDKESDDKRSKLIKKQAPTLRGLVRFVPLVLEEIFQSFLKRAKCTVINKEFFSKWAVSSRFYPL